MKKQFIGYYIIASAIIWGFVMVGSAFLLGGTEFKDNQSLMLFGGFIAHLLFIWGPLAIQIKKLREEYEKPTEEK